MTAAFLARYSKAQDQTILIIKKDIPENWESIRPDDDTHTGPSIDMYMPPMANLCLQGDVFVTQNDHYLVMTVQFRNGCVLDVKLNKQDESVEQFELNPEVELPKEIDEMVWDFMHYVMDLYLSEDSSD